MIRRATKRLVNTFVYILLRRKHTLLTRTSKLSGRCRFFCERAEFISTKRHSGPICNKSIQKYDWTHFQHWAESTLSNTLLMGLKATITRTSRFVYLHKIDLGPLNWHRSRLDRSKQKTRYSPGTSLEQRLHPLQTDKLVTISGGYHLQHKRNKVNYPLIVNIAYLLAVCIYFRAEFRTRIG